MRSLNRVTAMVASHLLLVNHFLFGLTYNSAVSPIHPNAIDGAFATRPHKMRHKKPPLVSYSLAGNQDPETNSISLGDGCGVGCLHCSPVNGCLSCRSSFFLSLRRDGPRQLAFCERSCPKGYYKTRYNGKGYCATCRVPGCRECSSGVRCSRCGPGYTRDSEQGLCHRTADTASAPGISMPKSDPQLTPIVDSPQMPPIVDPPVLLTEEPQQRRTNNAQKNKKMQRSGRRKLRRQKLGLLNSPLPRRRRPHRRRRPPRNRISGVSANRQNQQNLLGSRGPSNVTTLRPQKVAPERRLGRLNRLHNRTRGTVGRRTARRRKLKKRHRKRMKKVLQMLSKKRSRGAALENSKLTDENLSLRQFQPEVTLARPSRHVLREAVNATRPWAQAGRTINRTLHEGQTTPGSNESRERVIEHHKPGGPGGDATLMKDDNPPNYRSGTWLRSHVNSRNVTAHRRPRRRFRRRRRRLGDRKRKITEGS